jgi:putative DNA primase/helicase
LTSLPDPITITSPETSSRQFQHNSRRHLRRFIEAHGESRFTLLGRAANGGLCLPEGTIRTANRAGFRVRVGTDEDSRSVFLILPEVFKTEVCKGLDPMRVAQTLAARKLLWSEGGGHLTLKRSLPDLGSVRVYAVRSAILGDGHAQ